MYDARSSLSLQIEDALEGLPGFKSVSVLDFRSVSLLWLLILVLDLTAVLTLLPKLPQFVALTPFQLSAEL